MWIGPVKSSWGCLSYRWLSRSDSSVKPADPSTWLVQKIPQNMFLWALFYPAGTVYIDSTWTAPIWAGHCTTAVFSGGNCPTTLTPTHTFVYHILMLEQRFTDFPLNMDRLLSNLHLLSVRISSVSLQVFEEMCGHKGNDQQARWMCFY